MNTSRKRQIFWAGLASVISVVAALPTASAQRGSDPLAAVCQGFLSSSGLPSPGNADQLCGCLVREVQVGLSLAEMQAYQTATSTGQALPPGVQTKITLIATKCLAEAK